MHFVRARGQQHQLWSEWLPDRLWRWIERASSISSKLPDWTYLLNSIKPFKLTVLAMSICIQCGVQPWATSLWMGFRSIEMSSQMLTVTSATQPSHWLLHNSYYSKLPIGIQHSSNLMPSQQTPLKQHMETTKCLLVRFGMSTCTFSSSLLAWKSYLYTSIYLDRSLPTSPKKL